MTSSTHGPAARLKWRHNEPLFPRVSMDAWCRDRRELQGLPAKPWIVWHMTSSFCIYIVVLSFSDSRVSTRGINCGAVNCHSPRATHTAWTLALQQWVESRNYPNDKFISYTSWFNTFVYFPLHFRTPVFQHGASLVWIIGEVSGWNGVWPRHSPFVTFPRRSASNGDWRVIFFVTIHF